jgi:hypothetical protein
MTTASLSELLGKLTLSAPTKEVVAAAKADWRSVEPFVADLSTKLSAISKKNIAECMNAVLCISALAKEAMPFAQPYLVQHIGAVLSVCGAKQATPELRLAAENAVKVNKQKTHCSH